VTRLDKQQAAVIGAYTGVLCGPFDEMHDYVELVLGRPVWTHELPELRQAIREASRADFLALCRKTERRPT
jgi:hypothetical protein